MAFTTTGAGSALENSPVASYDLANSRPHGTEPAASNRADSANGVGATGVDTAPLPPRATIAQHGLWAWFHQGHWLGRRRTPFLVRLWRYGAGSVLAFVSSAVALFVCIQWIGLGATTSAVIAFLVGAIPNWILNRRWAWGKKEREGIGTETSLYVVVSLISLGISAGVTKLAAIGANHLQTHEVVEHLLVTGSYMLITVVLTGAKYVAYDRWVFVDRRARSRHQVPSTTELNRNP